MIVLLVGGLVVLLKIFPRLTYHVDSTVGFTAADVAFEHVFLEHGASANLLLLFNFLVLVLEPPYMDHIRSDYGRVTLEVIMVEDESGFRWLCHFQHDYAFERDIIFESIPIEKHAVLLPGNRNQRFQLILIEFRVAIVDQLPVVIQTRQWLWVFQQRLRGDAAVIRVHVVGEIAILYFDFACELSQSQD